MTQTFPCEFWDLGIFYPTFHDSQVSLCHVQGQPNGFFPSSHPTIIAQNQLTHSARHQAAHKSQCSNIARMQMFGRLHNFAWHATHWIDLISKLNHPSSCSEGCYALSREPSPGETTKHKTASHYIIRAPHIIFPCTCMRGPSALSTRENFIRNVVMVNNSGTSCFDFIFLRSARSFNLYE